MNNWTMQSIDYSTPPTLLSPHIMQTPRLCDLAAIHTLVTIVLRKTHSTCGHRQFMSTSISSVMSYAIKSITKFPDQFTTIIQYNRWL